jgi:hypothetical protein
MTVRIVRRLIRSLDVAGVVGVFCVLMVLPSAQDCADADAEIIPFGPMCADYVTCPVP